MSSNSVWDHLTLVTPPPRGDAGLIVSVKAAMDHCRVVPQPGGPFDETAWFRRTLQTAQGMIQGPRGGGIALLNQQWRLSLDMWPPSYILIPIAPVISIDAITYLPFGSPQGDPYLTLDPGQYVYDLDADPPRIRRALGVVWPLVAQPQPGAIKVTFTCGFAATPAAWPDEAAELQTAILLLVEHWYEHRSAVVGVDARDSSTPLPLGVDSILDRYRVGRLG